jgi:hypothetical protein
MAIGYGGCSLIAQHFVVISILDWWAVPTNPDYAEKGRRYRLTVQAFFV